MAAVYSVEYFLRLLLSGTVPSRLCGLVTTDWDGKEKNNAIIENRTPLEDPEPISWYFQIVRYAIKSYSLIDLISIIPFFLSIGRPVKSLLFFRILRLTRVIGLLNFKGSKKYTGLVQQTVKKSMPILVPLSLNVGVIMTLFACLIFMVENGQFTVTSDNPNGIYLRPTLDGSDVEESPFRSIPDALYFVVITTTTVGYGDLYPTTVMGRFLSCIFVYVGILITAFPIAIIAQNFVFQYVKLVKDDDEIERDPSMENNINSDHILSDIDGDETIMETKALLKSILNSTKQISKHADNLSTEADKIESFSSLLKLIATQPVDWDIEN